MAISRCIIYHIENDMEQSRIYVRNSLSSIYIQLVYYLYL